MSWCTTFALNKGRRLSGRWSFFISVRPHLYSSLFLALLFLSRCMKMFLARGKHTRNLHPFTSATFIEVEKVFSFAERCRNIVRFWRSRNLLLLEKWMLNFRIRRAYTLIKSSFEFLLLAPTFSSSPWPWQIGCATFMKIFSFIRCHLNLHMHKFTTNASTPGIYSLLTRNSYGKRAYIDFWNRISRSLQQTRLPGSRVLYYGSLKTSCPSDLFSTYWSFFSAQYSRIHRATLH